MPLGFFFKRESELFRSTTTVGVYGKVPQMGDFVRAGARPIASFETWLDTGMAWGEKRYGEAWPQAFLAGGMQSFVFRSPPSVKETAVLVGIMKPSRDTVGRRFPLAVFARVLEKQAAAAAHLLPFLLDTFLEEATGVVKDGDRLASASQFQERMHGITGPQLAADVTTSDYDAWTRSTPMVEVWSAIYGDGRSDAPFAALGAIRDALAPLARNESATTPLSLRLPLGSGGTPAAAFWIDAVRRTAGWRATVPTMFWSCRDTAQSILIQLGVTPPNSLAELWSPDPESDWVCDLTSSSNAGQREKLGEALEVELARDGATVGSVLDHLAP